MVASIVNFINGRWGIVIEPTPNDACAPPDNREERWLLSLAGQPLEARIVGASIVIEVDERKQ